jgi:hypothetical protein
MSKNGVRGLFHLLVRLAAAAFLVAIPLTNRSSADSSIVWFRPAVSDTVDTCATGTLEPMKMVPLAPKDLEVTALCKVPAGTYYYANVNIYRKSGVSAGGTLSFTDATIDLWANNILVENGGTLRAGVADDGTEPGPLGCSDAVRPYGCTGNTLVIHLWGKEDTKVTKGKGIACKEGDMCGVPDDIWKRNSPPNTSSCKKDDLPGGGTQNGVRDCFYKYSPLNYDGGDENAFFGYKVLAVSYGGILQLFGAKGAMYGDTNSMGVIKDPSDSGTSWVRLNSDLKGVDSSGKPQDSVITLDRPVPTWKMGDQIVLTSTDYMPAHAELLTLAADACPSGMCPAGNTITVTTPIQFAHNGHRYSLDKVPDRLSLDPNFKNSGVETRAAVALLRRSIRIVSGGDAVNSPFPDPPPPNTTPGYFFGGHTIARQGFKLFHVQGVEFYQLGEGGKIGHYPVHFHLARETMAGNDPTKIAFVKDSSVWDSMTRFYVIHGTHDITLARNVGYESIGHGYYLEDATEINNKLYSNLGILARAAVMNAQNPRQIPGLLAADYPPIKDQNPNVPFLPQELVPYHSDIDHPSVFWMTNGWNDFQYNMAAGATGCGVCFWFVPAWNSGPSSKMHWDSYAAEQSDSDRAGSSPMEKFFGNYCSGAMTSFQTIGNSAACQGIVRSVNDTAPIIDPRMAPIHNGLEDIPFDKGGIPKLPVKHAKNDPLFTPEEAKELATYYPNVSGGSRQATKCPEGKDCANKDAVKICGPGPSGLSNDPDEANCLPTVLDHYTSSFNWADFNLAAIWLRLQWYLVINSALTDIQNGGLTFVTGGGYTDSDEIPGYWALAYKDVFVGQTQGANPFALAGGPFNPMTNPTTGTGIIPSQRISCEVRPDKSLPGYCLDQDQGVSFPTSNFGGNQRFFNIYDGPSYEDSSAYLDINTTKGLDCTDAGSCGVSGWFNARQTGTPRDNTISENTNNCYLANAAIAWKQPNGFYYPPAFHSKNLFFNNVDIRHYVISPLYLPGTLTTNFATAKSHYCTATDAMFNNFSDVDRQTELDDDDGSLTGFANTISINLDPFFTAPVEGVECASGPYKEPLSSSLPPGTVKSSPYDYVTTAIFPKCLSKENGGELCNVGKLTWRQECSNTDCYGVPIYRQYVTNQEKNGPPMPVAIPTPSIRLAGQSQFQRSGLTVNNGTYFIDTSVGAQTQNPAHPDQASNVFEAHHTYYVYFLFAKPNTKQTYQIYVGKNDSDFTPTTNVQMVRARFPSFPYIFKQGTWPTADAAVNFAGWKRDATESDDPSVGYNSSTGIETIVVDMNNYKIFTDDYNDSKTNECAPANFCAPMNREGMPEAPKICACQLDKTDPLFSDCQYVCSNWANKDVKCPDGKCFGFSIKLTKNFTTIPQGDPSPQPTPECFPNNIFNISVTNVGGDLAGQCSTAVIPPFQMCN